MSINPFGTYSSIYSPVYQRLDQEFSLGHIPEYFIKSMVIPHLLFQSPTGFIRPSRTEASSLDWGSYVTYAKDHFQVVLDVQQFQPNEISIKLTENQLTIEGRHEEKQDQHGFISRHFIRKYSLPPNCDTTQLKTKLSCDGVLIISAPMIGGNCEPREIPIHQTGQPINCLEENF